jgi:hypothetical protein
LGQIATNGTRPGSILTFQRADHAPLISNLAPVQTFDVSCGFPGLSKAKIRGVSDICCSRHYNDPVVFTRTHVHEQCHSPMAVLALLISSGIQVYKGTTVVPDIQGIFVAIPRPLHLDFHQGVSEICAPHPRTTPVNAR